MNLDHIKIFINLAETLNFSKTARSMSISQPAVSQAIRSLENELGLKLFKRTKQSVSLTASGTIFYKQAVQGIKLLDKAIYESRLNYEKEKSSLTIGMTGTSFESNLLPTLVRNYHALHKDTNIYLEYYDHNGLKKNLLEQACDIIFTTQDDVVNYAEFSYFPLLTGHFSVAVPSVNSLVQKTVINLADLDHQRIILFTNSWCPPEQLKLQNLLRTECKHSEIITASNFGVVNTMIESGLGIAVMPDFTEFEDYPFFKVIPLNYDVSLSYGAVSLKSALSPNAQNFAKWLTVNGHVLH
ncbi:LysR family transcriptional regulator [Lactobacillus sp. ESL0791]|uniref:LysR family transcriptional regulator n=1 Tax=Lactobacillus sp. ESL0791 TaxID=2983234 RepID=UPI0023F7A74C|nr:LysR family transcriptional regulator [Lactobacillus sp. ESL0791]MDF7639114.1 LysR family transcriptional regulator [Lactobacillus sp. ESL0791]